MPRCRRFSGLLALLAFLVAWPAAAFGQQRPDLDPAAQKHLDAGLSLYNDGDYEEAIAEFKAAFEIDHNPVLLYAWAQAERLAGHCDRALELYEKFLEADPTPAQIEATKEPIGLCREALANQQREEPPAPEPPPEPPIETARPAPVDRDTWYSDPITVTLLASGVVAAGAGTAFLVMGDASAKRAEEAEVLEDFNRFSEQASSRRRIGVIAAGAGVALIAGGIVHLLLSGDDSEADSSVAVGVGASGFVVSGRF